MRPLPLTARITKPLIAFCDCFDSVALEIGKQNAYVMNRHRFVGASERLS